MYQKDYGTTKKIENNEQDATEKSLHVKPVWLEYSICNILLSHGLLEYILIKSPQIMTFY